MFPTFASEVRERWVRNAPFMIFGAAAMVAGGFVAAVAGAVTWGHGAWTAAFVVLVVGMAQVVLGLAQSALAPQLLERGRVIAQFALWNIGCAAVIGGTQTDSTAVVASGSVLFLAALVISGLTVRYHSALVGAPRVLLGVYRVLLVVLSLSVAVGIILSLAGS